VVTATTAIAWWQNGKDRTDELSLCLMLTLVYILNSLHSRPLEFAAEKDIREKNLKDTWVTRAEDELDDSDELEVPPVNVLGCFFPSSVIVDPLITTTPRVGPQCALVERTYELLCGGRSRFGVQLDVDTMSLKVGTKTASEVDGRIRRSHGKLPARGPTTEQEEINIPASIDVLGQGPLEVSSTLRTTQEELSRHLTGIVARMYMDLLHVSPNPKDRQAKSYCRLDAAGRKSASIREFQEPNLAVVWRKVMVFDDATYWDKAVECLFPIDVRAAPGQHYKTCGFHLEWRALVHSLSLGGRRELLNLVKVSRWHDRNFSGLPEDN
jgi:hypothetical protein